jgi:putative membrane protein
MSNKRHLIERSFVLLSFLCLAGCSRGRSVEAARDNRPPSVSAADQDFMTKAAAGNLSEIDMARVALQKSGNEAVRDFSNMIDKDHTAAFGELSDLMKDKKVPIPQTASPEARQEVNRMSRLKEPEFDREYINMMVADHEKTVDMFRDQIGTAQDPEIKKYDEDLLPKLEMHLEKARSLQSELFRTPR